MMICGLARAIRVNRRGVAIVLQGNLGQRVAGLHAVNAKADVVGHDARAVDDRHDHLVDLGAVLALSSNTSTKRRSSWKAAAPIAAAT